jgi:hypothetical protein
VEIRKEWGEGRKGVEIRMEKRGRMEGYGERNGEGREEEKRGEE